MQKEYKTIREISGPLVFVEKTEPVSFGELVQISLPDGTTKRGQVLDTSHDIVVVQIFEGTSGIDKQSVGQIAAEIRRVRPPNVYTGKGIRYAGEQVRIKPGKSASSA